jgi:hypothetical protein
MVLVGRGCSRRLMAVLLVGSVEGEDRMHVCIRSSWLLLMV